MVLPLSILQHANCPLSWLLHKLDLPIHPGYPSTISSVSDFAVMGLAE